MAEETLQKSKGNYILLIITIFLRWFGDSLFYAFMARYMKTLPFLSWQLSILTMMIPIAGMLGSAFLALFGTSLKRRRIIYLVLFSLECSVVAFFGFRDEFWYVLLFDLIANFCTGPSFTIIDTFIVSVTDKAKRTYASARQFGTLGYIVGVFGGGYLLSYLTDKWTFFLGGCLMLISSILFLCLRYDQQDVALDEKYKEKRSIRGTIHLLSKNRNYGFFLLALSLSSGMLLATDTAFSLFTVDLGISDTYFGYAFGSAIVMEFIVMLILQRSWRRRTMKIALIVGASAQLLRCVLFAIPFQNPNVYLFFDFLRGVSLGCFLVVTIVILRRILGDQLFYGGYFFYTLIKCILTAGMNFLVPLLSESLGYTPAFIILASLSFLGLLFTYFIRLDDKGVALPQGA